MKPFTITTPQLRWNAVENDYCLRSKWAVCGDELAKLFEIGKSKVISLQLSSEPDEDEESVAIVLCRTANSGMAFGWRKKQQPRRKIDELYITAGAWLLKKSPFREMAWFDEITVHVTVYTHDEDE